MKKALLLFCVAFFFSCSKNTFTEVQRYKYNKDEKTYFIGRTTGKKVMLLDENLKVILPEYHSIGSICEEAVWVKKDKKWGMVTFKNRVIIPFEADKETGCFKKGVITYTINGRRGAADNKGKKIIPFDYNNVYINDKAERIIAHKENATDLYDLKGNIISTGEYEYIGFFINGISIIRKNGKLGAVNYEMEVVCEPIYDNIGKFETDDKIAWVVLNQKIGYVDENFKVLIPIEYDNGTVFANGMVRVNKNGETLYLNRNGKQIFPSEKEIESYEKTLENIQRSYDMLQFSS